MNFENNGFENNNFENNSFENNEIETIEIENLDEQNLDAESNQYENEKKKLPKRNLVLYISIAVIMICVTFKASYAYYTGVVINTTEPTPTVVETGSLDIKFANNVQYLNAENLTLMTAAEAATASNNYSSFTVSNSGSIAGKYKLYLSNYSITENLVNADFKWKLTVDGTSYTGTFYDLFNGKTATNGVIASNSENIPLLTNKVSISGNTSHNCEFRVWIQDEDHNQIGLTEGTFSTTIKLIAEQA